jgi:hypothetical protein
MFLIPNNPYQNVRYTYVGKRGSKDKKKREREV